MAVGKERPAVTKVVEVEPSGVTLELSVDEAQILRNILGRFEGNGPTKSIYEALRGFTHYRSSGVRIAVSNGYGRQDSGVLYYEDTTNG